MAVKIIEGTKNIFKKELGEYIDSGYKIISDIKETTTYVNSWKNSKKVIVYSTIVNKVQTSRNYGYRRNRRVLKG